MSEYTKIAVTVPTATYAAVEKARAKLNKSRSAAVALALEEWLHGLAATEADRRYVEGYLRKPEDPADTDAWTAAGVNAWEAWKPVARVSGRAGERRATGRRKRR